MGLWDGLLVLFVLVPGILRVKELSENIWNIRSYECGNSYNGLENKTTF